MFQRFTAAARDITVRAMLEARALGSPAIGTEHLLLALIDDAAPVAAPALASLGVRRGEVLAALAPLAPDSGQGAAFSQEDAEALRSLGIDIDAVLERIASTFGGEALERAGRAASGARRGGHLPFSADAKEVLRQALLHAARQHSRQLDDGAILVGLVEAGGTATRVLADQGIDAAAVKGALDQAPPRSA